MKRILIDIRNLTPEFSGVGRYIRELIHHLPLQENFDQFIFFLLVHKKTPLSDFAKNHFQLIDSPYLPSDHPHNEWWSAFTLHKLIQQHSISLLHCPAFQVPWVSPPCPLITTIHDLGVLHMPFYFPWKFRHFLKFNIKKACHHSEAIITMSNTVKQELLNYYSPRCHIEPIPMGAFQETSAIKNTSSLPYEDYILVVGNIDPRKGHIDLFNAYNQLRKDHPLIKTKLIVIGKEIWNYTAPRELAQRLPHGQDIIFLNFVSDSSLISYYKQSKLIVLPSHYEGFGLPLIEAMQYNPHILCNDIPVFREIAAEHVNFTLFKNHSEASESMKHCLNHPSYTQTFSSDIYSWNHCAKHTLILYKHTIFKKCS